MCLRTPFLAKNVERYERLPDSKTGAKTVYAGSIVMNLLEETKNNPKRPKENPYVIWGKNAGSCLNNVQKPWRRFRGLEELDDVRIHDLRHSFASFMVNGGTSLAMIAKVLGHSQTKTTERYAHIMAEPLIATTERVTEKLGRLFNMEPIEPSTTQEKLKCNYDRTIKETSIKAPVYFSSDQAAEYSNVKQSLMEYWRWKKIGPAFIKVGSRIRYKLEALDEFLNNKALQQEII